MIAFTLRLWLDDLNLSITEFSELSGYDRKIVYRWIKGLSLPNLRSCRNIIDTIAHYAHWSAIKREKAFIELLNLRDNEMDMRKRRQKAQKQLKGKSIL